MAAVCDGETSGPRMPSRRSIDQRWDASRGLVFSQSRRAVLNDRTWSPNNGIKFSSTDHARRNYAQRPLGGLPPRPPTQTGQPTAQPVYGTNAMPSLERGTSPAGAAPKRTKQQQMEIEIQTRDRRIKSLESESAAWEKFYQNSQEEIKDLQHRTKEDKERIYQKGRDDESAAKAQTVSAIEKSLQKVEARRDEALEELRSLQNQLDQERTERASSIKSLEERLRDEKLRYANERRDRKDKHAKEMRQEKDIFLERKEQRRDYETYRDIFDTVHEERVVLKNAIVPPTAQVGEALDKARKLAKALRDFCAAHPGTASVGKQLEEMVNGRRDALEKHITDMKEEREALNNADLELKKAGHESRSLTQNVRFSSDDDPATALGAAFRALIEQPFTSFIDRIKEDESELRREIKNATSATIREELEASLDNKTKQKESVHRIRNLAILERTVQSLEAWKEAPYITKAVYTGSERFKKARNNINVLWYKNLDRHREGKASTEVSRRLNTDFRQKTRDVIRIIGDLDTEIRKGAHLREILGRTGEDSRKIDAFLDSRLEDARSNLEGDYRQLFDDNPGFRGSSRRARVLSRSPPRGSMSGAAKHATTIPRSDITHPVGLWQKNLDSVIAKRAAADSPRIRALYDGEIEKLKAKLSVGSSTTILTTHLVDTPLTSVSAPIAITRRSRMRSSKVRVSATSGFRRASTSTKPSGHVLGGERHMHDTSLPAAKAVLYNANQSAFANRAESPTNLVGNPTVGSHFGKIRGEEPRPVKADESSSGLASERSTTGSDASGKRSSPDVLQDEPGTDSATVGLEHSNSDSSPEETSTDNMAAPSRDPPLRFQIPQADFRSALMASPSSSAAFWKYSMYKDSEGKAPSRHYCTNYEQTEAQAAKFLDEKVVGFDIEWEIGAHPGKASAKRCVSLIQIASEDKVGLFHISLFRGNTLNELVPPSLRRLMETTDIIKTGVNIGGDARRLEQCLDVKMQGLFELSHLYKVVTFSENDPKKVNKVNFNLAAQVKNVLHLPLAKGEVRTSAWSRRLDNQQIEYAASDAYAGLRIFDALERQRKLMDPMPPRPAFYELKLPLVLGNGHVVVPKSQVVKQSDDNDAKAVEDEEDGDEFFDAVEEQEEDELTADVSATPSVNPSEATYPEPPQLENLTLSKEPSMAGQKPTDAQARAKPSNNPPASQTKCTSPESAAADQWATAIRMNFEAEGRKLTARPSNLRAYFLWHHQGYDVTRTAALLKDPPLAHATVVSYIVEAVTKANLNYDVERMREVMNHVPENVRWRYSAIVESIKKA